MSQAFWSELTIPHGRAARIRIGPLVVTAARFEREWRIYRRILEGNDEEIAIDREIAVEEPSDDAEVTRYATPNAGERLRIVPVLPDRSVLTRPEHAITILPRTEVKLYVGSPLWFRLLHGDDEPLGELPGSPPKEAWVGPSTRTGELCYATRTYGRLRIDDAALLPHRVMTAVTINNGSGLSFVCDHVSLPVRRLSVFASTEGRLWTEAVTLERTATDDLAKLEVGKGPPAEARGARLVSGPRDVGETAGRFRAFDALFR